MEPDTYRINLIFLAQVRKEVIGEKSEFEIAPRKIPVPVLGLNARFVGELKLNESVVYVVVGIIVHLEPIRLEMVLTYTYGSFLVETCHHDLISPRALLPHDAARLKRDTVSKKERVELVEGKASGASPLYCEEVALGEARLHGCDVDGLQEL